MFCFLWLHCEAVSLKIYFAAFNFIPLEVAKLSATQSKPNLKSPMRRTTCKLCSVTRVGLLLVCVLAGTEASPSGLWPFVYARFLPMTRPLAVDLAPPPIFQSQNIGPDAGPSPLRHSGGFFKTRPKVGGGSSVM